MGNAKAYHKRIFVECLCKANSQSLQALKLTGALEFRCRFLVFLY